MVNIVFRAAILAIFGDFRIVSLNLSKERRVWNVERLNEDLRLLYEACQVLLFT